jgi:gas vesicle protein
MSLFSHPIKKLTLLAAFGGGYVLGAKAGRERYEQIKQTAQQVADDPRVQNVSHQAQHFVRDTAEKVKDDPRLSDVADRVTSAVHRATDTVEDAAGSVTDEAQQADAKAKIHEVADAARQAAETAETATKGDTHPLLADEHVAVEDTVVYSTGPDTRDDAQDGTTGRA